MKYIRKIILLFFIITPLLLEGCVSLHQQQSFKSISREDRLNKLEKISSWDTKGALSITHFKKRDILSFKWLQKQSDYNITLSAPLHISSINIVGNSNKVTLFQSNDVFFTAETPEDLIYNQFGWRFPISNLRYWIISLPSPKSKISCARYDKYGHLVYLEQNGWLITYSDFYTNKTKNRIDLPKTIRLKKNSLSIKIKISRFQTISATPRKNLISFK